MRKRLVNKVGIGLAMYNPDGTLMSSEGERLIIRFYRNTRSEIFDLKGTRIPFNSKGDMITPDWKSLPIRIRE